MVEASHLTPFVSDTTNKYTVGLNVLEALLEKVYEVYRFFEFYELMQGGERKRNISRIWGQVYRHREKKEDTELGERKYETMHL